MSDVGDSPLNTPGFVAEDGAASRLGFHELFRSAQLGFDELCRSAEFDVFLDSLSHVYYPAHVAQNSRTVAKFPDSLLSVAHLAHLTLGMVRVGADTSFDAGAIGTYHISLPIVGAVGAQCGQQQIVAVPGRAAVFTPREHTFLPWCEPDATLVGIKIPRRVLENELESLLGHPISSCVNFDLKFDLTSGPGQSWLTSLRLLLSEVGDPRSLVHRSEQYCDYIQRLLIAGLLMAHRHEYQDELLAPSPPARPRTVRRVIQAIEEAPEEAWPLARMAKLAGVSGRRLQQGFAECVGVTPTAYLRLVRLQRAHEDLTIGFPVGEVAYRWGFGNVGRFASAYRDRFGETPSETLRRSP